MLGLTGGIGSGKSTVARMFAERGAIVIDTDAIARELSVAGGAAHERLLERFGTVERAALARMAFNDAQARRDLNAIVHPLVEEAVRSSLSRLRNADLVVVEVPLLVEAGWERMFSAVVVVDAPEELAVERVVAQRGMPAGDVRRRMAAQATREERLAAADHVLTNDGSADDLGHQVDRLLARLGTPAGDRTGEGAGSGR